jgi:hypothetical protein
MRKIGPVIDPLARRQPLGDKPDYAGLLSFAGAADAQAAAAVRSATITEASPRWATVSKPCRS